MDAKVRGTTPAFGGGWTERKLEILETYLNAYTTALKKKPFDLVYIDAFAGSGKIFRGSTIGDERDSMAFVMGSAERAAKVDDRTFDRLVFVEKDPKRCSELRRLSDQHLGRHIDIVEDDANIFLRNLTRLEFGRNWRGVLFVDPFGAQLEWATVEHVAGLERLDMWLLFPVGAIGRMLPLSRNPEPGWVKRLNTVCGGEQWRRLYSLVPDLFGEEEVERASGVDGFLKIYKGQLEEVFGSRFLNKSRTLRNSKNSPLFEFIFCAGHPRGAYTAKKIAKYLIEKM